MLKKEFEKINHLPPFLQLEERGTPPSKGGES